MPPLTMPTKVDEREVRDLEKRVRGLEGRVRGFEGLPPDREMALLEVERLRRELEGLARRREGLFEGLPSDELRRLGGESGSSKGAAKCLTNGHGPVSGAKPVSPTVAARQNVNVKGERTVVNGSKSIGKGSRKR